MRQGKEIEGVGEGYLMIKRAWPSSMRTLSGDHERFQNVYFSNFPGYYMTGAAACRPRRGACKLRQPAHPAASGANTFIAAKTEPGLWSSTQTMLTASTP